ncbi:MAG: MFS transporter [Castellaniella sp.]|uniref:MFS transporter n=1 Tax=Castellaniella sp. TaxID=1955812 RepID=UPI003C75E4CE
MNQLSLSALVSCFKHGLKIFVREIVLECFKKVFRDFHRDWKRRLGPSQYDMIALAHPRCADDQLEPKETPRVDAHNSHTPILSIQGVNLLLIVIILGVASFSVLLPLSPAWALARGASEAAAGSVTTVLMASTIMTQFAMNKALRTFGWAKVLALGLIALGAPATLQALGTGSAAILISSALRGIGFGILTVGGATAIALLVPAARRGAAVGVYGLALALPQLLLMSSAPVLEQRFGSLAMTLIATLPLAGLVLVRPLGGILGRHAASDQAPADAGLSKQPSTFRLIAPSLLVLLIATSGGGAVLTFASQMALDAPSAAIMLLCLTGFATPTRWIFGVLSDRHDILKMITGLCVVLVLGMAALSIALSIGDPHTAQWTLYLGSVLLGLAYGGLQSTSLVLAFRRGGSTRLTRVSVLWNVSFDLGTGVGALAAGALATAAGFPFAFACLTALSLLGAMIALRRLYSSA